MTPTPREMQWVSAIDRMHPCRSAQTWLSRYTDPRIAWAECTRGDWMLWLLGTLVDLDQWSRHRFVLIACEVARLAEPYWADDVPRLILETACRWAHGAVIDEAWLAKTVADADYVRTRTAAGALAAGAAADAASIVVNASTAVRAAAVARAAIHIDARAADTEAADAGYAVADAVADAVVASHDDDDALYTTGLIVVPGVVIDDSRVRAGALAQAADIVRTRVTVDEVLAALTTAEVQ